MFVIDTRTNEIAWTLAMNRGPSPMAVSKKPDGSTDKIFGHCPGSIVRFANWHRQIFLDSGILFRFKDS
jgi:hypothetical protein